MRIANLTALVFFLLSLPAFSQQAPWTHLPKSINVEFADGPVFLTLDTLKHNHGPIEDQDPLRFLLADSNVKVGYGYLDKNGNPFGVWRYYVSKDQQYSLLAEGYYITADTSVLSPANGKNVIDADLKAKYLEGIESKLMHSGEWRFYDNKALISRVFLSERSLVELHDVDEYNDQGEVVKTISVMPVKWRLIGEIDIVESYYRNGNLKSVSGRNGYNLNFPGEGTPVTHEPLPDL